MVTLAHPWERFQYLRRSAAQLAMNPPRGSAPRPLDNGDQRGTRTVFPLPAELPRLVGGYGRRPRAQRLRKLGPGTGQRWRCELLVPQRPAAAGHPAERRRRLQQEELERPDQDDD